MVLGSSPVAVTSPSDFAPASRKEFLDIQATIKCGFTLKRVRDMTRTYSCKDDMKILQDLRFQPSTYRVNDHLDDKPELLSGLQTLVFSAIFILEIVVLVTNVVTLFYSQRGGCKKYILSTHSHVLAYK